MSFSISVNLTGAGERKGPGGAEPVTGAYKVVLAEPTPHVKQGEAEAGSILFKATIADGGEHDGYVANIYLGLDMSKDGNRRGWRTALLSSGYSAAEIDGGDINLTPELFTGREAFIYYKARDPNDRASQSDKYFVTAEGYERLKNEAPVAAQTTTNSVSVQTTAVVNKPAAVTPATPAVIAGAAKPKVSGGLKSLLGK